jgi:hypothetical protein
MITMAFAIKEPVNCIPAERKLGIKKIQTLHVYC